MDFGFNKIIFRKNTNIMENKNNSTKPGASYLTILDDILFLVEEIEKKSLEITKSLEEKDDENIVGHFEERQKLIENFQSQEKKIKEGLEKKKFIPSQEFNNTSLEIKKTLDRIIKIDIENGKLMSGKKSEFLDELKMIEKWKRMKKGYGNLTDSQSAFLDIFE